MTKTIPLTQGQYTIIDDEDYERVNQYLWQARRDKSGNYYAMRTDRGDGKKRTVPMHRFILDAPANLLVDHANRDTLDNRRVNLRVCTRAQNNYNRKLLSNNRSGYKGVSWKNGRWSAQINFKRKIIWLGSFDTPEAAAAAYDAAAIKYHGEFASLNTALPQEWDVRPTVAVEERIVNPRGKSGYWGAYAHGEHWVAKIKIDGKNIHLGVYNTPTEAAKAYDVAARKYKGEFAMLNFPDSPVAEAQRMGPRHGYLGVCPTTSGKWRARITVNKKTVQIGYYDTPEQAAMAWDRAAISYRGKGTRTNFPQDAGE